MSVTADLVALREAADATQRVYAFGAVPAKPEYPYTVIAYAPDVPALRDMLGGGDPVRTFTVQHFSRTAAGLEDITDTTIAAFDGQPVDGDVCALIATQRPDRDPDDRGVLSTTHVYRF